mmetsp:Transcript_17841/g.35936  ORF Transcript_17841/g.35936 Transcript_17841/m.35936 type:complete len:454 (+) Transcript_17841:987-2348(+)
MEENVERNNRRAEEEACHPLVFGEVRAPKRRVQPRDLHERNLSNEGADDDDEEDLVLEHAVEHVELVVDLPRVHLVEDLHEDKHVEHHRVVLRVASATLVGLGAEVVGAEGLAGGVHGEGVRGVERWRTHALHPVHVVCARAAALDGAVVVDVHAPSALVAVALADVAEAKDERRQHQQLPGGVEDHVAHHRLRQHSLVAGVWLACEEGGGGVLGGEGERRERVHDQIDPEHLYCVEGALREDGGADARQRARRDVHRQLELKELADVVVDAAAPLDGGDDGDEVVVHDDHVRRVLRNVSPLDAHGEADVGLLERRRVVGPVARHCDGLGDARGGGGLDARDEHVLVERRRPRKHTQRRPHLVELVLLDVAVTVRHAVPECLPVQDGLGSVLGRDDAALGRDRTGRVEVVSGDHADSDACLLALGNGVGDLVAERVLDPDQTHARQLLLNLWE